MNYTIVKKVSSTAELIKKIPLSTAGYQRIQKDREETKAILAGDDPRLLMIVGPCSAWPSDAVMTYAKRLKKLIPQVEQSLKVIMRVYIQKPRSTHGWTGPVNQPDPFADADIETGRRYARQLMVDIIEMGIPIADEALFTHQAGSILELLSWVAIGARSSEDQEHRIFASSTDCAVGLKNPTHGALNIAVNSVIAAQAKHAALLDGYQIQTHGNDYAHVVLRGTKESPNYSISHLESIQQQLNTQAVKNPAVIIDVSHDNSIINGKKDPLLQPTIILKTLAELRDRADLKSLVKGFMVESFLQSGRQTIDPTHPEAIDFNGLSITDPCLGWEQTEQLLLDMHRELSE